jgi:hypothetical protein
MFNGGMHNEARCGRPSVVTEDLKDRVDAYFREDRFAIDELHEVFP